MEELNKALTDFFSGLYQKKKRKLWRFVVLIIYLDSYNYNHKRRLQDLNLREETLIRSMPVQLPLNQRTIANKADAFARFCQAGFIITKSIQDLVISIMTDSERTSYSLDLESEI